MPMQEVVYFEVKDLLAVGMTFVVLGIALAYGLNVLTDVKADFCTYKDAYGVCTNSTGGTSGATFSLEYNATHEAQLAITKIPGKLGLIVTVILASVVIGILIRYLFIRFG